MSESHTLTPHPPEAGRFEIRLTGHLDARWTAWFDGLTVTYATDGATVISGQVPDQAALYGLLQRVRDLGLPLESVKRVDIDQPDLPTNLIRQPLPERTQTWLPTSRTHSR